MTWCAHGGISKKNLDHFSPSFLGQKYYSLSHIQSTVQTKVEFVIYWVLTLIGMSPENKKNAHL